MKKLSKTQIEVLRRLAEPGAVAYFITGFNAHWFLSVVMKTVRYSTMKRLIEAGYLGTEKDFMGRYKIAYVLPAGRAALAAAEGEEKDNG